MGKDLHCQIINFLEKVLEKHSQISSWDKIDFKEHYIYQAKRVNGLSDMIIHLSDEYEYNLNNYFQKSEQIIEKLFILITRPEATYDNSVVEIPTKDKISIGKFGALMGALYSKEHWNYVPKERKKDD